MSRTLYPTQFAKELQVAIALARDAGALIMRYYADGFAVQYKDAYQTDPVTEADKAANQLIVTGLAEAFPADGILAEESLPSVDRLNCQRVWCVDPLDGTREFIEHNGQFAIMIGLAIDGRAALGVVFEAEKNALYWGAEQTAYVEYNEETPPTRLHVSQNNTTLESRLMVSRSHQSRTVDRVATDLQITQRIPLGSVGLKVARLCTRDADVYFSVSNRTQEWDACAPEAILHAAGGRMTDICGRPLQYNKPTTETPFGMLATNGILHDTCVEALTAVARERAWI